MSGRAVLNEIATVRRFSAKITSRGVLRSKMPIVLMAAIEEAACPTTDIATHEAVCPTADDTTHEDVCLIVCPELYIREAIHQLAKDCIHQIASSG